ncbi:MAG TPA: response regulator [Polyangiales bacterium]|jgi:CheY-like chemotaxis protein/HPt (histidine-containing phosphotransfer) domain-containing protein|nr:response regulator [Polyangiales bacterium]
MPEPLRILVVEDNPDTRTFVAQVLRASKHRVDEASDGAEALVSVAAVRYDMILTDIEMPRLDGVDATRAVRELEREQDREQTPIVAITAQDRPETRRRAHDAGMNGFLVKPVRSKELQTAILTWADQRTCVLVVDDDDQQRQLVSTWLKGLSEMRVLHAARAGAAVAMLRRERVDLVLLDMVMPGIDGYAAARLLRALPEGKTLPIVAVTAHSGDAERAKCLAAGCSDYLAKPVQKADLLELVQRHRRTEAPPGSARSDAPQPPAASVRQPAAPRVQMPPPAPVPQPVADEELDPDAAALLPMFLENRAGDVVKLRDALTSKSFDVITRIGHNLRGSGGSYGFPKLSALGEQMENAGKANDASTCARLLLALEQQLAQINAQRNSQR